MLFKAAVFSGTSCLLSLFCLFVGLAFFIFFVFFFLFVFGGSWRGLLASVGSFGCHLVPIFESFSSLFRDRVDL